MSNRALLWLALAAGALGLWWTFRRRPALGVVGPTSGGMLDPIAAFFNDLGNLGQGPGRLQQLPPIAPTGLAGSSQFKGVAVQAGGYAGAAAATAACAVTAPGPWCALAAPAGKVVGQYSTQGAIYVAGKTADAARAVGSGAKSVFHALTPW